MSEQLYDSWAHAAHKELLKEDLSYRISSSINNAGNLFRALVLSETQQVDYTEDLQALSALKTRASLAENATLKRVLNLQYAELEAELQQNIKPPIKTVNKNDYLEFLEDFFELWIESKDQISADKWGKEGLKEDITELFDNAKDSKHHPSAALELFLDYMNALKKSGIINFTSKTFKKGEQFRGSIG